MSAHMAHDVFICHASKDKRIADAICAELESSGLNCWIAPRDISVGEDWMEAVRSAIESSLLFVLIYSENANAAPHIEKEIAHGFYTGRMIVLVRLVKALPRRDFLFYLCNAQWIDGVGQSADQDFKTLAVQTKALLTGLGSNSLHGNSSQTLMVRRVTPNPIDERADSPQSVPIGIPRIAKLIAIFGSAIVAVSLGWWLTAQQTDPDRAPKDNLLPSTNNRVSHSPTAAKAEAPEPVPHYEFSRFGLWVPASSSPTPLVQGNPTSTPSSAPEVQTANASPFSSPRLNQNGGGEEEALPAQQNADVGALLDKSARPAIQNELHRGRPQKKAYDRKAKLSKESRLASLQGRLKAFFHKSVKRIRDTRNRFGWIP